MSKGTDPTTLSETPGVRHMLKSGGCLLYHLEKHELALLTESVGLFIFLIKLKLAQRFAGESCCLALTSGRCCKNWSAGETVAGESSGCPRSLTGSLAAFEVQNLAPQGL